MKSQDVANMYSLLIVINCRFISQIYSSVSIFLL
jgi:hypothetical protein